MSKYLLGFSRLLLILSVCFLLYTAVTVGGNKSYWRPEAAFTHKACEAIAAEEAPDFRYNSATKWESPFDPNKIFMEWPTLKVVPMGNVLCVVVGNPKIDWTKVDPNEDPTEMMPPKGEFAASITYGFMPINGEFFLMSYLHKNEFGIFEAYVFDKETHIYVKKCVPDGKKDSFSI